MNIFVLNPVPMQCAREHCDKHVVKMILETAQLLSTAHHELGGKLPKDIYKSTHRNHPCAIWARAAVGNYNWLYELGMQLCIEYTHRYGKVHKTQAVLARLRKPPRSIPNTGITPWAQAMPEQYQVPNDAVAAYRAYYVGEKSRMLQYTNRQRPDWLN